MQNIYQKDYKVVPELFTLIKENRNEEAKNYLNRNPQEINLKGWMDHTPLHKAAEYGNYEMAQFLIQKGANVNSERSGVYATPLCWAKTVEIAKLLLDNGATMNDRELDHATRSNRCDVIDLLLTKKAKIIPAEPQYLLCNSIDVLKVYEKHQIPINGCDKHGSNLLHQYAWKDDPELFDYAFSKGVEWKKDSSHRTPYALAQQGGRKKMIEHLRLKYPQYTSHRIEEIGDVKKQEFERIDFLKGIPENENQFIALTKNSKLFKYELLNNEFRLVKGISIDVPAIRNFTFDKEGRLIVPTADSKLLIMDSGSLKLIDSISLEKDYKFEQITYLPKKRIFVASTRGWEAFILNEEFKLIHRQIMEDGMFYPIVNSEENLVSFYSYDQETYFSLYELKTDCTFKFIHTFFQDMGNCSSGFDFDDREMTVSYPNEIILKVYENEKLEIKWRKKTNSYPSKHGFSCLVFIDRSVIALGKGKKVVFFSKQDGTVLKELNFNLKEEIDGVYFENISDNLILKTGAELKCISLKKMNLTD